MKKIKALAAFLVTVCVLILAVSCKESEAQTVYILKDGATEYSIVYSKDSVDHYKLASTLFSEMLIEYSVDSIERYASDDTDNVRDKEIVIGESDREITVALKAAIAEKNVTNDGVWWAYGYRNGKLGYFANSKEAADLSFADFFELICKESTVEVMDDLWVVGGMSAADYEAYVQEMEEELAQKEAAARKQKIAVLRERIAAINTDMGSLPSFTSAYGEPSFEVAYDHPRLWVNENTLPDVIANLTRGENATVYNGLLKFVDLEYTGRLGKLDAGKRYNFTATDVAKVEALAFMYLTTGDEIYGYTAIRAAKNFLATVQVLPDKKSWTSDEIYDISNISSSMMNVMAEVYDWCYDLLSSQDKEFMVKGVINRLACNLEVANPPKNTACVTGHSTAILTLRDWPAFAVAVADEYPEIYTHIMGLLENSYAEAPNWYYPSGANFQGSAYGINKTHLHILAEYLVYTMSGSKLYSDEVDFERLIYTYLAYLRPDEESIRIGDDFSQLGSNYNTSSIMATYGTFFYDDPVFKAWAMKLTGDYRSVDMSNGKRSLTLTMVLLFNDPTVPKDMSVLYDMPLVNYTGAPSTSIIARSAWGDPDAWMTYTDISEAYGANHDHLDTGTFQIYYKGILTPDSGAYQYMTAENGAYGGVYDKAYVKQTVAHNGLLIYNPKYANNSGWVYSGGQRLAVGENGTLDEWLVKETSRQAKTLGYGWEYNESGEIVYAYASSDITNAYDQDTVDLVMRSTISIATGDPDHPLLFIVYDRITSDDASFKKTYLLHTTGAPTFLDTPSCVTDENGIVTVTGANAFYYTNSLGASGAYEMNSKEDKYNGKLTATTLLPEDPTFTVIGGDGKRFWVCGQNRGEEGDPNAAIAVELGWGRVEISPSEENLTDSFLNVMYVGDADATGAAAEYIGALLVKSDTHEGAISFGNCVMFSKTNKPITDAFSFDASAGNGEITYYVSGLSEGKWEITVNGEAVTNVVVDKASGMATFTAEAGEVSFEPKFGGLEFELNEGELASGAELPTIYSYGESLTLPTDLSRDMFVFDGWYKEADFSGEKVSALDGSDTGALTLYAKWNQVQAKLELELNKGTSEDELPERYDYGTALTLPTNLTKVGSEFIGWFDNPECTGTPVIEISADHKGDVKLYAGWNRLFAVLIFELDGGTMSSDSLMKLPTEEYQLPTNVTKENAEFVGWYLEPTFDTRVTSVTGVAGEDLTVYARYVEYTEPSTTYRDTNHQIGGATRIQYGDMLEKSEDKALTLVFIPYSDDLDSVRNGHIRVRTNEGKYAVLPIYVSNNDVLDARGRIITTYGKGDEIHVVLDFDDNELRYYVNGVFFDCVTEAGFASDLSLYNFDGADTFTYLWQYNAQETDSDFTVAMIKGDMYAKDKGYAPITLNSEYGSAHPAFFPNKTDYTLPVPTELGYRFLGWYDNEACEGESVTVIPAGSEGGFTLYAKWEKVSSAINLELNGGVATSALPELYEYGTVLMLPADVTKYGSIFLGWYDNEACEGEAITEIGADRRGDVTLYAKWQRDFGVIYLHTNGGTYEGSFSDVIVVGQTITLPTLTREGAEFLGWYLDAGFTVRADATFAPASDDDIHAYAKWKYMIESGNSAVRNVSYGDILVQNGGVITFVFTSDWGGAGAERSGGIRVRNRHLQNEVYVLKFANDEIATLGGTVISDYADAERIAVVMDFIGGSLSYYVDGEYAVTEYASFASDLQTYNYEMYDGSKNINYLWQYNASDKATNKAFSVEVWTGDLYSDSKGYGSVELELDDGAIEGDIPDLYLSKEGLVLPTPTKYGYTFLGWYDNADLEGDAITEIPVGAQGDYKLYAKWEKAFDVIELHLDGGRLNGAFDAELKLGVTTVLPTDVSKEGSLFGGWYADEELTERIESVTPDGSGSVHAYARWYELVESTANADRGQRNIAYGDILNANGKCLTFVFEADPTGADGGRSAVIRVRNKYIKNQVNVLQLSRSTILSKDGTALSDFADAEQIFVVMDFEKDELRYYIDGEHICTDAAGFNADILTYNYTRSDGQSEINYLWQYSGSGSTAFSTYIIAGDIYASLSAD